MGMGKYDNPLLDELENAFNWKKDTHESYVSKTGKLKDRVIRHDIMHQVIANPTRKRPLRLKVEDEFANAIIQAVLEGTARISYSPFSDTNGRTVPKFEPINEQAIRDITLPQARKFFTDILGRKNIPVSKRFQDPVSETFIKKYLEIGRLFRQQFKQRYGKEYICTDTEELLSIAKELRPLYEAAEKEQAASGQSQKFMR